MSVSRTSLRQDRSADEAKVTAHYDVPASQPRLDRTPSLGVLGWRRGTGLPAPPIPSLSQPVSRSYPMRPMRACLRCRP